MKLGNITISKKLGIGFGSVLVLLALVSILSFIGIENVGSCAHGLIQANDFDAQLDIAEKDHVKWVDHVTALLTDDNINTLDVETDPHKCRFGQWYYGEARKSIEARLPSLSHILNKIEEKHEKLHQSAITIKKNYKYEALLSAVQAKEKIFPQFGAIGENFTADLIRVMETIIDPAKAVAETEENIKEMVKWGEIDMEMNEGVIQPFLLLRIEVSSMAQKQTEVQFDICLKQLKAVEQGIADWSVLVAGTKDLNDVVKELNTYIQAFSVVMDDYIKVLRAEKIARASIDQAKKIYRETTIVALDDIRSIFIEAKSEGRKHAITEEELLGKIHRVEINVLIISIVAFIIGISLAILVARNIIRPIGTAVGFSKELAKGDLTQTMDIDQSDETGVLVKSLNNMAKNLRTMFTEIATGTQTLKTSSTELSCISEQIFTNSEQTAEKSNNVAASAEEMTANMNGVAAATEQASVNIQMIVSAAEEMSSTISEIAGNTAKGSETTNKAVEAAKEVSQKVDELGRAASEINKVTETIADISEQTNLLALNATIEAARAGEAGKGFAVVAGEIKALAQQTAEATNEISNRIARVQKTTEESVSSIDSIVSIISEVNQIVTTVAAAIEEQSATTQEIVNNVTQAFQGIQEVNENIGQTSSVAGKVTKDIAEVSQAAGEMNNGSRQVKTSAEELSKLAEQLNKMIERFEI